MPDITAAWLAARLGTPPIAEITTQPVGNGLVGTSIRFTLRYEIPSPHAPSSVVGKFPATDPTSRDSAAFMRLYLRETSFYRDIAPLVKIRTPHVFHNHYDPATHDFVLLFEDLAPARAGDQLTGCDTNDAATAMREIAGLHAPLWDNPLIDTFDWLTPPAAETPRIVQMVAPVADMFHDRFASILEPEVMRAVMRLKPLGETILCDQPRVRTVLHGDFRLDNVLFDTKAGQWPLATVDWQTTGRGCGTLDASYFLGAGLRAWDRAAHEQDLLRIYHDQLIAYGVRGYAWDECWRDYRKHALNGLFMAMFSAISVARTGRGDEMFLTMARRHAQQALELGAFELW